MGLRGLVHQVVRLLRPPERGHRRRTGRWDRCDDSVLATAFIARASRMTIRLDPSIVIYAGLRRPWVLPSRSDRVSARLHSRR